MSIMSLPVLVMASISFYVGLYHLLIYLRRRQHREDLTFALLCLTTSLYDVFCVGLYNTTSVAQGVGWQRAQFVALALFVPAFLWFVLEYTHQKPNFVVYAISSFYLLAFIVQIVDHGRLTWIVDQPSIKNVVLPFGLRIVYYEATLGAFTTFQSVMGMIVSTYILWKGIQFYKHGYKREAVPLLLSMGIMYIAAFNDTAVSNGLYIFIYTIEYGYMAIIFLMAYSLSDTIVEAAISEGALRESEERFRSLVETTSDWVWEVDRNGLYTYSSPKVRELLGYEPEEIIGKTPFDLMPPKEAKRIGKIFDDILTSQKPFDRLKNTNCHQDGRLMVLETSGVPFFDASGRLLGYRGIDRDITEREETEEALRESQQMLRSILDTIPVRVFWKDRDSKYLGCNRTFALDAGLNSPEDLIGKVDSQMGWAEQAELYRSDDRTIITTGQPKLNYEEPQTAPDGRLIWLRTSKIPLLDAVGQVKGVLGTYEEITERKRADEALHRQMKELTVLHAVAMAGAESVSVDQLIERVTHIVGETLYVDNFGVLLLDDAKQSLRPHYSYHGSYIKSLDSVHISNGIIGHVVTTGKSYYAADVRKDPYYLKSSPKTLSELCVPIKIGERPIGVINAESPDLDFFNTDDERLLVTIAGALATAIEKIHLFEAERTRRQEAETLRQAAAAVSSSLELRQVLDTILLSLKQVVPYDSASMILKEGDHLHVMAVQGFAEPDKIITQVFPTDNELFIETERTRKPVVLLDAKTDPRFERWAGIDYIRGWMGIPLILRETVIGYITLDSRQPSAYDEDSAKLAQTFGQHAMIAIENARLYKQAINTAERWASLHQAGREIAHASQDLDLVYEAVHKAASRLMPAEAFVITLLDESRNETVAVYLVDKGGRWPEQHVPADQGLSGQVVTTGESVIIYDLTTKPGSNLIHFGDEEQVKSILAVPLRLGDKVIGMLSTQSYHAYTYTDEDQAFLEMLAATAAIAIDNARLYAETRYRLTELEAVSQISTSLRTALTVEEMLPGLLDETLEALDSDCGAISLYDPPSGMLKLVAARGWFMNINMEPAKPGEGMGGTVFVTNQAVITNEFATDPMNRESIRNRIPPGWGGACVPIRTMQETIGVMFVSVPLPRQLQPEELHLMATISEIAGNAIRRADLHQQTERQLQRLASLRAIDSAISTILDLRVTLGVLLDHISVQLKVDAVDILLLNPNTQSLEHAASIGFRTEAIKQTRWHTSDSLADQVVRNRRLVYAPNLAENEYYQRRQPLVGEDFVTYYGVPLIVKGQIKGVLEIFHRKPLNPDAEWRGFLETLAGETAIAIDNAAMFEELQRTNLDLSLAYDATIEGWSKALDLRDQETEGHTLRVTDMTLQLARMMGVRDVDLIHIRRGTLLHDIGKMGIPDSILNKAGKLTDEELETMHHHPVFAYEMLSPISYLRPALDIPFYHHERWDGSGYPRGLKGEQIPLAARIFAVVDVWDALTSNRPYRRAWTKKAALEYIRKKSGKLFDPKAADVFLKMVVEH